MPETVVVSPDGLRIFAADVVRGLGAEPDSAARVAGSLVESDLRGHTSHGVRRLVPYAGMVDAGDIDPGPPRSCCPTHRPPPSSSTVATGSVS